MDMVYASHFYTYTNLWLLCLGVDGVKHMATNVLDVLKHMATNVLDVLVDARSLMLSFLSLIEEVVVRTTC
jgi:hypothetical protein